MIKGRDAVEMHGISQLSLQSVCYFHMSRLEPVCAFPLISSSEHPQGYSNVWRTYLRLNDCRLPIRKITLSEFISVKIIPACILMCMCVRMAGDRGFSCSGICLGLMCALCVFLALPRGDPTHRLSLTDSVFIATERWERDGVRGREERRRRKEGRKGEIRCRGRKKPKTQWDDREEGDERTYLWAKNLKTKQKKKGCLCQEALIFICTSTVSTDVSNLLTTATHAASFTSWWAMSPVLPNWLLTVTFAAIL